MGEMPPPEEEDLPRFSNIGIISEWHQLRSDFATFLALVKVGDRLEFQREGYCHWAIFVGEQYIPIDEKMHVLPCIVHRANPADDENLNANGGFSTSSRSLRKGAYGIGDVVLEPLRDVWSSSRLRINNSLDNKSSPFPKEEIVERVMGVVLGEDRQSYTPYNLVTNNCEHFASWARNGWALSAQVIAVSDTILKCGAVVVSALLPRPLAIAGGVCLTGLQLLKEIRRIQP